MCYFLVARKIKAKNIKISQIYLFLIKKSIYIFYKAIKCF